MIQKPHRSALVKSWNLFSNVLPTHIMAPQLRLNGVMDEAIRTAGSSDFGEMDFLKPLERLLQSMEATAHLHPFGRFYVKKLLSGQLVHRLKLTACLKKHPDILTQRIKRPIIILGMPRTGSSFLFNLLAQDPSHRYLTNWEVVVSQVPPPGDYTFKNDPRRKAGKNLMRLQNHLAPAMKQIHTFSMDGPEECTPLLMQSFTTSAYTFMFNVPAYAAWYETASRTGAYRHHKRILQTLQWKYPKQHWLLKAPQHMDGLKALLETYPDACLIQTHRDPVKSVASYASLSATFRGITSSEIDYRELGRQTIKQLASSHQRFSEQRARIDPDRIMDITYDELISNPTQTVRRVYQNFEISWPTGTAERVDTFLAKDKKGSRKHGYHPDQFGLTAAHIQKCFQTQDVTDVRQQTVATRSAVRQ